MMKEDLYKMWSILRCMMDGEDINELKKINPNYRDMNVNDSSENIIMACVDISNAITNICPPELDKKLDL